MADEDLVSQVRVTGIDEANRQFTTLGQTGEKAFQDIDRAAEQSSSGINKALAGIRAGIQSLKQLQPAAGALGSIEQLRAGFQRLSAGVNQAAGAFNTFQERTKRVVGIATGLSVGLIAAARASAKSFDEAGKAQDENTQAQLRALQSSQEIQAAEFAHQQTLKSLTGELSRGEITFEQYNAKLQQVNREYKESRKAAAFAKDQAETLRLETERLQKQAAKTKAFDDLADKMGTTLASAMITAGRAAGVFIGDIQKSLGPALASIVQRVTQLFEQNREAIIGFFDRIAAAIDSFVQSGGVERAFANVGQAISIIGNIINTVIIPAFQGFIAVCNQAAAAINAVFGTNVSGSALAIIVVLGLFTKSFTILFGVITAGVGAVQILVGALLRLPSVIGAITLAARVLITTLSVFVAGLGPIGLAILAITLAVAAFAAAGGDVVAAWNAVVVFFTKTLPDAVTGFFKSVGETSSAAWQAIVDTTIEIWNGLITFFTETMPQAIVNAFTFLGQAIVSIFESAVASVTSFFTSLLQAAKDKIQPIIDMLKVLSSLLGGASDGVSAAGGGTISRAGGGRVHGPGTSTSDSVPAWLSVGEWVIRAKAVRKYGHAFMRALNNGSLDVGRIARLAMGGMVSPVPVRAMKFAGGGPISGGGGRPLTLNLPGESFQATVSEDEAGKIIRYAVRKSARSAGKKPNWVGR